MSPTTDNETAEKTRLVLDVVVRENTRSETFTDFETLFREQFGAAYDEVEINVSSAVGRERQSVDTENQQRASR